MQWRWTKYCSPRTPRGKRIGHRVLDSTATTKDLHTGELSSSVGQSDTFTCTDNFIYVHLDIPHPPRVGVVTMTSNIRPMCQFSTSLPDRPPVLELTNQYGILTCNDTYKLSLNPASDEPSPLKWLTVPPLSMAQAKATTVTGTRTMNNNEEHAEVGLNPAT